MSPPKLSIIVPVYNEREQLRSFLDMLTEQRNIVFELLFCDGGSTDGTPEQLRTLAENYPFSVCIIDCAKGRAAQMNTGVKNAQCDTLLFLHIDSRFSDSLALSKGWFQLETVQRRSFKNIAGHFSLKFHRHNNENSKVYYHMECKARLDRKECTHGDQGFMLKKTFFEEIGGFDTLYPIAEDTRFADMIRLQGEWVLFQTQIETSARRFEVEGVAQRQTLNSLMMNFVSIGWSDFFAEASGVYATQDSAGKLRLAPYLRLIRSLLKKMPFRERLRFWYETGRYVRANAWQISFYFDTRHQYRSGLDPGTGVNRYLGFFDKWIEPLLDHPPARILAGFLTWTWYRLSLIRFAIRPE
jgi:rSAM/selenodomain-associated transferase 2